MLYREHPNSKKTPSRKSRKGERNTTFIYNYTLRRKLNREKRALQVNTEQ
jgi:hypothetical protein